MRPLYKQMSEAALRRALSLHRGNYEILYEQVATSGKNHASLEKLNGLGDEESSIKAILAEFKRRGLDPPPPEGSTEDAPLDAAPNRLDAEQNTIKAVQTESTQRGQNTIKIVKAESTQRGMGLVYENLNDNALGEQLRIHWRSHDLLAAQVAEFGQMNTPAHKLIELDDEQNTIKAILAEFKRRGLTPPPVPSSTHGQRVATENEARLQPSQNIRADLLLARVLVQSGDNRQRAWSTLQSIMLADAAQGEAWYLISQLLDDPAQRADALDRATRHGYGGSKKRNWEGLVLWSVIGLAMILGSVLMVLYAIEVRQRGSGGAMILVASALLIFVCLSLFSGTQIRQHWTRLDLAARRAQRRGYGIMLIGMLASALFILINAAWMYQRWILGLPIPADSLTSLLIFGVTTFALSVIVGPLALVEIAPELALSRGLARFFDRSVVLVGVILAGLAVIGGSVLPWWMLGSATIVGLTLIGIAIFAYRRGESFFDAMLDITGSNISKPPRSPGSGEHKDKHF